MLYTPRTMEELEIIFDLVLDAYNYVTGRGVTAAVNNDVTAGTRS